MANCSGDSNVTSTEGQASAITAGIAVFLSALNNFLPITASVGNALILVALHKVSSIHPPTKLLFRCLAVTDLCGGLMLQPLFATTVLGAITKIKWNILYFFIRVNFALGFILYGVSFFTSTAVSVDRLLALLLGLRYRQVVTFCHCLFLVSWCFRCKLILLFEPL